MTARIVFADGSKALANNTNDLRQRWAERKTRDVGEIIDIHQAGIVVKDYPSPCSVEEAQSYRDELVMQLNTLQARRVVLRGYQTNIKVSLSDYHFSEAAALINIQLVAINRYIKTENKSQFAAAQRAKRDGKRQRLEERQQQQDGRKQRLEATLKTLCDAIEATGCEEENVQEALKVARKLIGD